MIPSTRLCVLDSEGEILFTSQGWKDFLVHSSSPYAPLLEVGINLLEQKHMPPMDPVGLVRLGAQAVLNGDKESFSFEFSERALQGKKRTIRVEVSPLTLPDRGCQVVVKDITGQLQMDEDASFFARLEKLISEASFLLTQSSSAELDENIRMSLREVSLFVGADYSFISRLSPDHQFTSMSHGWHSNPPIGFSETFQKVPIETNPFREKLFANESFFIENLDEIPERFEEYRKRCREVDAKSIAGVPFLLEGTVDGYVGFVTTRQFRQWADRELMILRVLSEIYAAAFLRQRIESSLREREKNLLTIYRDAADAFWCIKYLTPISIHLPVEKQLELLRLNEIEDCNEAGAKLAGFGSREEIIGRKVSEVIPYLRDRGSTAIGEHIRGYVHDGYRCINARVEEKSASGVRVLLHQAQGVVQDGKLVRTWVSCRDITGSAEAEKTETGGARYRNSSLTPQEIRDYTARIEKVMKNDRHYRDPNFNLAKLSRLIRAPDYQVSQVLNTGMNASFYDLVNRYRIEELEELMSSPAHDAISILDLAYRVGFNSKSSFNTAFKKITGMTPSTYRAEKQALRGSFA